MLRAIELENFKAFGQRTRIPLAPITLIFGENSAGKSSIIQSLSLFKQSVRNRDLGTFLLPKTENGFVDLGSFQDLIFDHDMNRSVSFRFELKSSTIGGIELTFCPPSPDKDIRLSQIKILGGPSLETVAIFDYLGLYDEVNLLNDQSDHYDLGRAASEIEVTVLKCSYLTCDPKLWMPKYEFAKNIRLNILSVLKDDEERIKRSRKTQMENEKILDSSCFTDNHISSDTNNKGLVLSNDYLKEIQNTIEFYSSDFTVEDYIKRMTKDQLNQTIITIGFLPVGFGFLKYTSTPELFDFVSERRSEKSLGSIQDRTFDIWDLMSQAYTSLEAFLSTVFPIAPIRKAPERLYIFRGTTPRDVGYRGEFLPDFLFRNAKYLNQINEWLGKKRLDTGYQLKINTLKSDLFEIYMQDDRRQKKVDVNISDVGYGVSQLLPLIVQSLAGKEQIITIEQPEVHIHPKLQADLGDLFVEAAKLNHNQFIIETHSEHLILRLLRRIRETTDDELADENLRLKPEDVSILYVKAEAEGSTIRQIPITPDGDFATKWPNGFFTERAKELF